MSPQRSQFPRPRNNFKQGDTGVKDVLSEVPVSSLNVAWDVKPVYKLIPEFDS